MEIKFKKHLENIQREVISKSVDLDEDVKEFTVDIGDYQLNSKMFSISPRCIRCDLCVKECPVHAISSATMVRRSKVNDNCVKCEICAETCPVSCIYVMEVDSYVENDIDQVTYDIKEIKVPHRVLRMEEIYINHDKCVVCGNCTKFCPTNAISLRNVFSESETFEEIEKQSTLFKDLTSSMVADVIKVKDENEKYSQINESLCVGCGSCSNLCPQNAITLKRYLGPIIQTKELLINQNVCVQCYICEESCPVDAIKLEDGKLLLNTNKCIQCDVCSTNCPVSALKLKKLGEND
ncbi:MAG: 4Fe-4S binding protein [Methanobrevibacter sp.]|jgi:ferredoxin|nr:4Fe-4S binding protein [Methanobrevibacter sp.]